MTHRGVDAGDDAVAPTSSTATSSTPARRREPTGTGAGNRILPGAAVHAERDAPHLDHLRQEQVGERQREVAVGDRAAEGRLGGGPLDVDVDPLVVAGGVGERVSPAPG